MNKDKLTIISFNIWDLPLFTHKSRVSRIKKIAEFLKDSKTDIICLQEAWNLDSQKLIKEIVGPHYYSGQDKIIASKNKLRGFSNAAGGLMILSAFPITSLRFTPFGIFHWSWTEWFGNKGILEVYMETTFGKVRIINTHLFQPGLRTRLRQFGKMLNYLSNDQATPVIMAGDFNEDKLLEQTSFATILKDQHYFHPPLNKDAPKHTHRVENPHTQTWLNKIRASKHLDYFFLKNTDRLNLEVEYYAPLHLDPPLSDHDPIMITLTSKK